MTRRCLRQARNGSPLKRGRVQGSEELRGRRLQENSVAAAQSYRRGFLALQIQHHPAAHHPASGDQSSRTRWRTTPLFFAATPRNSTALCSDVLISVTSFFRNPEAFETLQREVLPKLLTAAGRRSDPRLGARLLHRARGVFHRHRRSWKRRRSRRADATSKCSPPTSTKSCWTRLGTGCIAKTLADDISPERLRRFFVEEQGGYRVSKVAARDGRLRAAEPHRRSALLADGPDQLPQPADLSRIRALQKKAIPTFHYALKPGGFLLLGASESVGGFTEPLRAGGQEAQDLSPRRRRRPRRFICRPGESRPSEPHGDRCRLFRSDASLPGGAEPPDGFRGELSAQREADRITVNQFAPPGVLVNAELQVSAIPRPDRRVPRTARGQGELRRAEDGAGRA